MEFELKGGVLIIGSLFWQDDKNPQKKDELRLKWRQENLNITQSVEVEIPIRYGRFSKEASYTMVFDNSLSKEDYGTGKAVPFLNSKSTLNQLNSLTHSLSEIEGGTTNTFIKGFKDVWCVCGIVFNPAVPKEVKANILQKWGSKLKENQTGYQTFKKSAEKYSMSQSGELLIRWPDNLDSLDLLIATSTKPKKRENSIELTPKEIANYMHNRNYFLPNIHHGIRTFQDNDILDELKFLPRTVEYNSIPDDKDKDSTP
jgi:hypothetical protein